MRGAVEAHGQRGATDFAHLVVRGEAPVGGHAGGPFAQHLLVVQLAEVLRGVQDAQAHVGGAVADAEHPAVAGQELAVAAGKLEPAFHPVVVVPRRGEVGPHSHAERPVVALPMPSETAVRVEFPSAARTTSALKSRVSPVLRPESSSSAARTPVTRPSSERSASVTLWRSSTTAPADWACRASCSSKPSRVRISPYCGKSATSGQGSSIVRPPAIRRRPLFRRQPSVSGCGESQLLDLADRARGESVAADLLAGKAGFLQHRDVNAGFGKVVGGGGSGRARPDDQYIHSRDRLSAGPGDVAAQLGHGSGVGGQRRSAGGRAG